LKRVYDILSDLSNITILKDERDYSKNTSILTLKITSHRTLTGYDIEFNVKRQEENIFVSKFMVSSAGFFEDHLKLIIAWDR